jgi:hypothetical protein
MGEIVSRNELSNQLMKGVGGVGAGIGLLILLPWVAGVPGLIAASILGLIGLILSASKTQRKAGAVAIGAAVVTGAVAILQKVPIINSLFWIAPIGLIIAGGFSLYKFFKNMKARR